MLKLHRLTLSEAHPPRTLGRYILIEHEDGRRLTLPAETLDSHISVLLDLCCCTECPRDCPICAECRDAAGKILPEGGGVCGGA